MICFPKKGQVPKPPRSYGMAYSHYYRATLAWFQENRHRLSALRKRTFLTWLKIMRRRSQ